MNISLHKTSAVFMAAVFMGMAAAAAWYQNPVLLFVPFIFMAVFILLQHPVILFYLLVVSIPWSIEFNITPQLGTDLPDEPLMWLTSFLFLSLIVFHYKKIRLNGIHPLYLLLVLQFIWLIFTVLSSTDILLSVKFLLAKSWYLLSFAAAPYILFREKKTLKRAAILLLVSMMLFMMITLVRHSIKGFAFENINEALLPFYRNHVNYSALLVFMVPIQLVVLQLTTSRKIRFVIICALVITIGALYFSYARGAWLALLTGLCAYWLIRRKALLPAYILVIIFSVAAVVYLSSNDRYVKFSNDKSTIFHTNFREHLIATYRLKDMSNGERVYRWVAGFRMIGDNWKTGFGPSTFYQNYKNYTVPSFRTYVSRNEEQSTVHNYFLLMIIEQGVIGLLLFLVLLGVTFWYVQKVYRQTTDRFWKVAVATAGAIMVMECTVNFLSDMIETDKIGSVFYMCIAVVAVASVANRQIQTGQELKPVI